MSDPQGEAPAGPTYAERVATLTAARVARGNVSVQKSKWTQPKGGKITNKVHPREEEYAYVTPSDLRDFSDFGWMEYVLSQAGGFFFAGALWQSVSILAEQEKFKITPWLFACGLSMVFGIILMLIGGALFLSKQAKIKKYFPKEEEQD